MVAALSPAANLFYLPTSRLIPITPSSTYLRASSARFTMTLNWYHEGGLLHTSEESDRKRLVTGELTCASPISLLSSSLLLR
jgi:hypothetical protein